MKMKLYSNLKQKCIHSGKEQKSTTNPTVSMMAPPFGEVVPCANWSQMVSQLAVGFASWEPHQHIPQQKPTVWLWPYISIICLICIYINLSLSHDPSEIVVVNQSSYPGSSHIVYISICIYLYICIYIYIQIMPSNTSTTMEPQVLGVEEEGGRWQLLDQVIRNIPSSWWAQPKA